ncbi:MAG TPA: hypothetical protein VF787_06035, partial [Thermoanaerobaculia bacterium]
GGGPEIPPGDYTITIKFRGQEAKQSVRVLPDPRDTFTPAQRQAKYDAILRAGKVQETIVEAINRITKTRNDIDAVAAKLKKEDDDPSAEPPPLVKSGTELKTKLDAMEKRLWTPPKTKGIPAEKDVMAKIGYPFYSLQSSWDAPTAAQLTYLERAEKQLRETLVDYNKLFAQDVAKYREEVRKSNVVLLTEEPPL